MRYPKFYLHKFLSKRKLAQNFKLAMEKDCRYCTATNCIKGCSALFLQTKFELLEIRGGRSDVLNETLYSIAEPEYADADFNEQEEEPPCEQKDIDINEQEEPPCEQKSTQKEIESVASESKSVDNDPFDLKKLEEAVKQARLKKGGDYKNE